MGTASGALAAAGASRPLPASHWWRRYAVQVASTDALAVAVAVAIAYVVRFDANGAARVDGTFSPTYLSLSLVLALVWLAVLSVGRTRDRRLVGSGPREYARVLGVTWRLFAAVAVVAYLLHMQIGRGYLAMTAPVGVVFLLLTRLAWRRWLRRRRRRGELTSAVLIVGSRGQAARMIDELEHLPEAGYGVVGVCVPEEREPSGDVAGVPVLGGVDDAARLATELGASAVAVAGSDAVDSETVRSLGWDLEGTGIDLALSLGLVDVAGPRVVVSPVDGLPLVFVDEPQFTGRRYVAKTALDVVGAAVLLILLTPLLVGLLVALVVADRGPVLYRQERVGKDGHPFHMLKFRTMVVDAESHLEEVLALEGAAEVGLFYKPHQDPRVTRVGRVLRRYSLDELPQLVNVLRGHMSLVGPRPQVAAEVALYDDLASRRLLVKPGMTGLWQVSGRSELTVDESIRMDVRYVENWSVVGDLLILSRTARAVMVGAGAY
ncbi:sugar transferase [Luteimicrobium subarcticum]|uniref:sugar transferase n=1 Tax=Luteimicrobium subarcticum TaxID=620910 RepID=UPI001FE55AF1|nr:sugar transferase [Luteimicrobium subarcticum]